MMHKWQVWKGDRIEIITESEPFEFEDRSLSKRYKNECEKNLAEWRRNNPDYQPTMDEVAFTIGLVKIEDEVQ